MVEAIELHALRGDAIRAIERAFDRRKVIDDPNELEKLVARLCRDFHTLAVAGLLVDGEPAKFHLNLLRAAENCRRHLTHCVRRGSRLPPCSRMNALFGAVAAGGWQVGAAIVELSENVKRAPLEYVDEFLQARAFHSLVRTPISRGAVESAVDALEAVDPGIHSGRIAVMRALGARDERAFHAAMRQANAQHETELEKRVTAPSTSITALAPYRYVWFEGLAYLRCAERSGLSYDFQLLYCPPLALATPSVNYSGDWVLPFDA